jgi:hypothetical protein
MSDARQRWTDIAKALGFVLAGTVGIIVLVAFFQGFQDGYREQLPAESPEHSAAEVDP